MTATHSPSSTRIQEAGAGPTHRSWDPHGTSKLEKLNCEPAEWEETHATPGRDLDDHNGEGLPRPPATQTNQPPKGNPKLPPQFLRSLRIPRQWMPDFLMRAMQSSSTVKSVTSGPSHQSVPKAALGQLGGNPKHRPTGPQRQPNLMASGSPETFQPPEGALSWEPDVGRGLPQALWGLFLLA